MEGCEMIKPRHKRGFWKPEEDLMLRKYVEAHGEGNWTAVSKKSGLQRGAKSCRLRWKNYLRPNIKRGMMSEDEKDLIIRLHKLLGNRWSLIAGRIPGRTDNEIKNYWNTHLNKKPSRDQIKKLDSHTEGKQHPKPSTSEIRKEENAEAAMEVSAKEKEKEGDSSVQDCLKIVDSYGMNSMAPLPPVYSPLFHNYDNYLAFQDGLAFMEAFGNDAEEILLFQ